jgi:2-polyprenyl-3-methyl-5-hydroxy-6-metoxy-1,4-benzoquinol methylase
VCPVNGRPADFYCRKGEAEYYIESTSGVIFQRALPTVARMMEYADNEYAGGVYREYANARDLKAATVEPRLAAIKKFTAGKRLLDVGCATGFLLEVAAAQGFEVTGVEFSTVAISLARPDIRERIVHGDVNALINQKMQFDVSIAFDIVEHVQDPRNFLSDIYDVLVPGGVLALSTPDTGHFLRHLMMSNWPMLQPMQHTVLFSRRALKALLEDCGFVEVSVETARKVLTLDYLTDQLAATNPALHRAYRPLRPLLPRVLRDRPFAVNIGEMLVYARKPL